jgi:DNA-binding XRE family transcriptional regulator
VSFQEVLGAAGFTKVELAVLYGVSRQTIHTWSDGGAPRPGSYTARMATTITKALLVAVAGRLLPLGAMAKEARAARIKRMAGTLQLLKPAPAR